MKKENHLAKQPTHSDLLREIEELKKRVEKLEPHDELAKYKELLDEIQKAMPKKEYVPYWPAPYDPNPYHPYPWWIGPIYTCTSGSSTDNTDYNKVSI